MTTVLILQLMLVALPLLHQPSCRCDHGKLLGPLFFFLGGQAIRKPAWLEALDAQRFFVGCCLHENAKKNEKNICCLDCCTSICPHCVSSHRRHRLLQVRRYVYHDVVRLEDLEKLIDCSSVQVGVPPLHSFSSSKKLSVSCLLQSYTINSSKVVFLKKRPQSRQFKGSGNICTSCDRSLQEPFVHCSLGCKLSPDYIIPHDVDEETTHSTIVEGDEHTVSSDSERLSLPCTTTPFQIMNSKASWPCISATSPAAASDVHASRNMSRRKSVPHRSPLC
ncbi:hypothetical protein GW17_00000770 [Ensete ventricosum]|nr:hypothetical protein GW17_00000770 [Ensete ventricosum]